MTSIECHIGNAPDAYNKDPTANVGTGKFHSIANCKNYSRRTLRLVKSLIGYLTDTLTPFFVIVVVIYICEILFVDSNRFWHLHL